MIPDKRFLPACFVAAALLAVLHASPFAATTALGQAQPSLPQEPETWRMTVHAHNVTRPALRHALLPDSSERTPGNAAPLYLIAMAQARQVKVPEVNAEELKQKGLPPSDEPDMMSYFLGLPLEQVPVNELADFLRPYESALQALDIAARRDFCHWDLQTREQGLMAAPLVHLNDARHLANVASMRARLHAVRGEHAEAVRAIGAVLQLGLDVADQGVLIQSLVGTGLGAVATSRVRDVVQRPGAPNLYWPLANLPRPFMSLRATMAQERAALLATFPELRRADTDPMTAGEWAKFLNRLPNLGRESAARGGTPATVESTLGPAAAGTLLYPQAKRFLVEHGSDAKAVDAMPVPEALGRYVLTLYRSQFDEVIKWADFPYAQGIPEMVRAEEALKQSTSNSPLGLFASVVPAMSRAAAQFAMLDRRVAALQTVEAIRAYAAANGGKLPAKLEDITATPAPADPVTGKPFAYTVDAAAGRATLQSPPPPGFTPRSGLRVEVTLAK